MSRHPLFRDGGSFNGQFDLPNGPLLVLARVNIAGTELRLSKATMYPLTSAKLKLGVRDVLRVFREISDMAQEEGFSRCSA